MHGYTIYMATSYNEMAWFDVGCIGLFTANIFALRNFTADTSIEAYELVYTTNLVIKKMNGAVHIVFCYIPYLVHVEVVRYAITML